METVTVTFQNGKKKEYAKGIMLKDIVEDIKDKIKFDVICGKFKNDYISYEDSIIKSGELYLYDINTPRGNKIYERGLEILFKSVLIDMFGKGVKYKIRHSIDKGVFYEFKEKVQDDTLKIIKDKMMEKVNKGLPFQKIETSRIEAIEYFKSIKREDKAKTLFYDTSNFVTLYKFDGIYEYIVGEVPYDASVLKYFDLTYIENKGIVLRFPSIYDNGKVVKYRHHEKLFHVLEEYQMWGNILKLSNIGDLNEAITHGRGGEVIKLSEIIQDYKLLNIAEELYLNKSEKKFILLSGPSSSGKTTTSKRLALYLKTAGLNPCAVSLDDYFHNREDAPLDENGNPDFESLRAINVKLFDSQMSKLLKGNKVVLPTFDFVTGKKVYNRPVKLGENDILIIEGLHALSEEILKDIPRRNKYKIYLSPLAHINIDNDNRINMTDIRLLRRIVRDNRTRGYNPEQTITGWDEVRKGEEKYVFPNQDTCDVIYNTSLAYELPILKTYVEPLLFSVSESSGVYETALRLITLLKFVMPLSSEAIPDTSIMREFIGGSYFR